MYGVNEATNQASQAMQAASRQAIAGSLGQLGHDIPAPPRVQEIPNATTALNDRAETLLKELITLETRLSAILRPQPPQAASNQPGQPKYAAGTQLGQAIAQVTGTVDSCIDRARMMLDLLEL